MKIIAATGNQGKIVEIKKIFSPLGFDVVTQKEAGFDIDVEENGKTFEENALIKARAIAKLCDDYVISDDSGLCVDALGGRPGIYSARYAGEDTPYSEKIKRLLEELSPFPDKSAHFMTSVAFITPDGREITANGVVYGHIVDKPQGNNGFGYDPIFYSDELKKTFAMATLEEKNSISHRGRALRALYEIIKEEI